MSDQTAAAAPAPGASITPTPNPAAESLLRQVDSVHTKMEELQKARAADAARAQELEARARELEEKNRTHEARFAHQAKIYAEKAEPMFKEWLADFEKNLAAQGRPPLSEEKKAGYRQAFTHPDYESSRDELWAQHQANVQVTASRKALEEKLKEQELEQARLKEEVAKANQKLGSGLRSGYVETIAASARNTTDETEDTNVGVTASGRARGPGGSARALAPGEIMVAAASVAELPFLKKAGFSGTFSVTASNASTGEGEYRAMRSAPVRAAPEHTMLRDPESKDINFPRSIRYSHPAIFGWLMNESGLLHTDVSHMTHVTNSKEFPNIEQRVDTVMGGTTVGLSVPK